MDLSRCGGAGLSDERRWAEEYAGDEDEACELGADVHSVSVKASRIRVEE